MHRDWLLRGSRRHHRFDSLLSPELRLRNKLCVDVERGLDVGVPHHALHVLRVGAGLDGPCCPRGPETAPVDPGDADLRASLLDVTAQDVVVAERGLPVLDALENEIVGTVQLHDLVRPDAFSIHNGQRLEPLDAVVKRNRDSDRSLALLGLGLGPISATAPLVHHDAVAGEFLSVLTPDGLAT